MQTNSDLMFQEGKNAFEKNDFDQAIEALNNLIETDPEYSEAYFLLANIFHTRGEIGKAIKGFNQVLRLNPNHTDAAISLSVLYNDIGKYEEAKSIFDRANERIKAQSTKSGGGDPLINKKFSSKHAELADLYMGYNRFDEALFEYNKAVGLNPNDLALRVKVAKVYVKKGFMAKAFDELKKLKNEVPSFIPARLALGILHYGQGNIIEAQNEWKRILAKDPNHQEAKTYLKIAQTASETNLI